MVERSHSTSNDDIMRQTIVVEYCCINHEEKSKPLLIYEISNMLADYCPFKTYRMKYLHVVTYPEVVNRCQVEMDEMIECDCLPVRKIL